MNLISVLKRVSIKHLLKGVLLAIRRPFFIGPTMKATKDCIRVSTKNYGKLHQKNGPANAFRHALWNYMIAKRCLKWATKETSVLDWAKQITDWHEDAFPNDALARRMDLHNNRVGRQIFQENPTISEADAIELFKKMTKESTKIDINSDLSQLKTQLVHIISTQN